MTAYSRRYDFRVHCRSMSGRRGEWKDRKKKKKRPRNHISFFLFYFSTTVIHITHTSMFTHGYKYNDRRAEIVEKHAQPVTLNSPNRWNKSPHNRTVDCSNRNEYEYSRSIAQLWTGPHAPPFACPCVVLWTRAFTAFRFSVEIARTFKYIASTYLRTGHDFEKTKKKKRRKMITKNSPPARCIRHRYDRGECRPEANRARHYFKYCKNEPWRNYSRTTRVDKRRCLRPDTCSETFCPLNTECKVKKSTHTHTYIWA